MLLFLGRPRRPKRARSHRNTVSSQLVNTIQPQSSSGSGVERDVGFLGDPDAMEQDG
jgi:hypothetical protein